MERNRQVKVKGSRSRWYIICSCNCDKEVVKMTCKVQWRRELVLGPPVVVVVDYKAFWYIVETVHLLEARETHYLGITFYESK